MKMKKNHILYTGAFILAFVIALIWLKPDKEIVKEEVAQPEILQVVEDDGVGEEKILLPKDEDLVQVEISEEKVSEDPVETISENIEEDGIPASFIAENNLPPYAGENGGPGIFGSDVNDNEIRDDIEREIFWTYRDFPEEVRDVFLASAVSATRSLNLAFEKRFDEESLTERLKSFKETVACKVYYIDKNINGKIIPNYKVSKKAYNIEGRADLEASTHLYQFSEEATDETRDMYWRVEDSAHQYSNEVYAQMETDGLPDDKKARAFCKEVSAKYLQQ